MAQRQLQDWLKTYMQFTAYSESPEALHFWTGVSTLAGGLRRKTYFDQVYYKWSPNFYIIFVAPPGIVSKSTSMSIGMNLLKSIPDIKFGPNAITWQALVTSLSESTVAVPINDQGDFESMSCLTFASSEMGTLLDPRDRSMVDLLVDLWDGQDGAWKKATKTSGNDTVVNPWLNIIACTTPTWIAENMPKGVVGGGFTSRCIFIFAKAKRSLIAYPKDSVPKEFFVLKEKLIHDLELISQLKGSFELTPEAKAWGEVWYAEHYKKAHLLNMDQFGGYLARKQCHMHKLAMVLSASYKDELVITESDLTKASKILDALEADLPQVFRSLETSQEMEKTERLLAYIKVRGEVEKMTLYRDFVHVMSLKDFTDAIAAGIQAGYLSMVVKGDQAYLRFTGAGA